MFDSLSFLFYYSLMKEQLMEGDFASNVKLLQNFPPIDINQVLMRAVYLKKS